MAILLDFVDLDVMDLVEHDAAFWPQLYFAFAALRPLPVPFPMRDRTRPATLWVVADPGVGQELLRSSHGRRYRL